MGIMTLLKSDLVKFVIIIVFAAIIFFFLYKALSKKNVNESFQSELENYNPESELPPTNNFSETTNYEAESSQNTTFPNENININENRDNSSVLEQQGIPKLTPNPSEGLGQNEVFKPVDNGNSDNPFGLNGNQ